MLEGYSDEQAPIVFTFAGQGSQYYQMGLELYQNEPIFKQYLDQLDSVATELVGKSIVASMYANNKSKADSFSHLQTTHPAIVMVEYALAKLMMAKGIQPDLVIGTSVGEFASAAIAGILTPEQMIEFAVRQAEFVTSQCEKGTMLAILADYADIENSLPSGTTIELVSVNFSKHCVIAGSTHDIEQVKKMLSNDNITSVPLPVEYAFHSNLLDAASTTYLSFLKQQSIGPANIRMISCLDTHTVSSIEPDYFWHVTRQPIRFREVIQQLESDGKKYRYIDLSPSGTLATYLKYICSNDTRSNIYMLLNLFSQDMKNLHSILEQIADKKL